MKEIFHPFSTLWKYRAMTIVLYSKLLSIWEIVMFVVLLLIVLKVSFVDNQYLTQATQSRFQLDLNASVAL